MNRLADVSRVTDAAGVSVHIAYKSSLCEECGYELHGLDPGHPCPECGHVTAPAAAAPKPQDLAWRRSVSVGLVLLLWVTLDAVAAVLVQPFSDDLAGTLPALNVPAPKFWAVPLLQRSIGRGPEFARRGAGLGGNLPFFNFPGPKVWVAGSVPEVGTYYYYRSSGLLGRAALLALNLAAVWLVTLRPAEESNRAARVLRPLARWAAIAALGAAHGVAAGWAASTRQLADEYRSELFAVVTVFGEMPATLLIYAYLAALAHGWLKRPRLRTQFAAVGVLAPLLVGASFAAFVLAREYYPRRLAPPVLAASAAYGVVMFALAVWASVLLLSLAAALVSDRVLVATDRIGVEPGSEATWGGVRHVR